MDATSTTASHVGVASTSMNAAHDEDPRYGQHSTAYAQSSKTAANMPPAVGPASQPDASARDTKVAGTWFHEDCQDSDGPTLVSRPSRILKGKGKGKDESEVETMDLKQKTPLNLLDLPMDILKEIVKEVTHTNDLTSLALCHSALHRLTTPYIYSRFDIVWPDSSAHAEPRSGVDALTYGLATLVMAEEVFGEAPYQQRAVHGNRFNPQGRGRATETTIRRRRGNHYAQYTRKFSLGNGPPDWVNDYLISKEGGKMLCTLVALSVARMRSLETFIWDMPTGVLRDVWLALSSLNDRYDGIPCRLEKVWVRWHDNSSQDSSLLPPPRPTPVTLPVALQGAQLDAGLSHLSHPALDRVEHPSFSVLPPMKSLSVLDIDELAYLDEMAVCIGKSLDKLRELRVGIAPHALTRTWVSVWEGDGLQQVDPDYPTAGSVTIGERRLGGVLGTLTGFVCDARKPRMSLPLRSRARRTSTKATNPAPDAPSAPLARRDGPSNRSCVDLVGNAGLQDVIPDLSVNEPEDALAFASPAGIAEATFSELPSVVTSGGPVLQSRQSAPSISNHNVLPLDFLEEPPPALDHKLQLEHLELERVPISVSVSQKAFDWSYLTSLTLLHCPNHEQLWKTLRRCFTPTPKSPTYPAPRRSAPGTSLRRGGVGIQNGSGKGSDQVTYKLALKKIHTNTVSAALIAFLKETLAPNSLEVLFLQEARSYSSSVTIDAIFRGPLKRHRASLKKVLIDSSEKLPDGTPTTSSRWRRWMLNQDVLTFICNGKMPALRELGVAMEYKYWHYFLQHLPSIPHLRSLYIPYLADHVHGANLEPRELALQILDIVALRPEVQLCYMGIANKCFEIMENRRNSLRNGASAAAEFGLSSLGPGATGDFGHGTVGPHATSGEDEDWANDDDDIQDGDDEEDDDDDDNAAGNNPAHHPSATQHHHHHHSPAGPAATLNAPHVHIHHAGLDAESDHEHDHDHHGALDDPDQPDHASASDGHGDEDAGDADNDIDVDDDDALDDHHDDDDDDDDSDFDDEATGSAAALMGPRLRLREILFYDDKVAVFKARHGRL